MVIDSRFEKLSQPELNKLAQRASGRSIWEAGFVMNHFVIPSDTNFEQIHPWGVDGPWTTTDADLSSAVLVSLVRGAKRLFHSLISLLPPGPRSRAL